MKLAELQQAGFNEAEIQEYIGGKTQTLKQAGFADNEINDYFGAQVSTAVAESPTPASQISPRDQQILDWQAKTTGEQIMSLLPEPPKPKVAPEVFAQPPIAADPNEMGRPQQKTQQLESKQGQITAGPKQGFFEVLFRDIAKKIPGSPAGARETAKLLAASEKVKWVNFYEEQNLPVPEDLKEGLEEDTEFLTKWYLQNQEREKRGYTFGGKVAQGLSELPKWMIEFYFTGGTKTTIEEIAEKAVGKIIKQQALKNVVSETGAWVATGAARATLFSHRVAEETIQRQLPGMDFDEKGDLRITNVPTENWATSLAKGWGSVWIEAASEESGEALTKYGAIALRKMPFGSKFVDGLYDTWQKIKPKGTQAQFFNELFRKGGYSNIIGEIGEERLATLMHSIAGTQDFGLGPDSGIIDRLKTGIEQDIKNLPVEFTVLSVPGAARYAIGKLGEATQNRQPLTPSETSATIGQATPEPPPILQKTTAEGVAGPALTGGPAIAPGKNKMEAIRDRINELVELSKTPEGVKNIDKLADEMEQLDNEYEYLKNLESKDVDQLVRDAKKRGIEIPRHKSKTKLIRLLRGEDPVLMKANNRLDQTGTGLRIEAQEDGTYNLIVPTDRAGAFNVKNFTDIQSAVNYANKTISSPAIEPEPQVTTIAPELIQKEIALTPEGAAKIAELQPGVAMDIATKDQPSRKDVSKLGITGWSAQERATLASLLREELAKTKGVSNAEGAGTIAIQTGEEAGVEGQAIERLRLRDTTENGLEATAGNEVAPPAGKTYEQLVIELPEGNNKEAGFAALETALKNNPELTDEEGYKIVYDTAQKRAGKIGKIKGRKLAPSSEAQAIEAGGKEPARPQIEQPAITQEQKTDWSNGQERPFKFDENSTENEGRFRLYPPTELKSDTYKSQTSIKTRGIEETPGVRFLVASNKYGKRVIQAIRFDKSIMPEDKAAKWWEENKSKFEFYKQKQTKQGITDTAETQAIEEPTKPPAEEPKPPKGTVKSRSVLAKEMADYLEKEGKTLDLNYTRMNIDEQVNKTIDFVAEHPDEALRIGYGGKNNTDIKTSAIKAGLFFQAKADGNWDLAEKFADNSVTYNTEKGQEIAVLKGFIEDDSPLKIYSKLKSNLTDAASKKFGVGKEGSATKKVGERRNKMVSKAAEEVTMKGKKLDDAQTFINSLRC